MKLFIAKIQVHSMKVFFLSLIIILTLSACAINYSKPKQHQFSKETIIPKSYDEVWNKTVEWFANNGTPIKNLDKNSGFIATEYSLKINEQYLDCGDCKGNAALDNPVGSLNVIFRQDDNNTKVTINAFFKSGMKITNSWGGCFGLPIGEIINCESTGLLEKTIMDYLSK